MSLCLSIFVPFRFQCLFIIITIINIVFFPFNFSHFRYSHMSGEPFLSLTHCRYYLF